MSDSQHTSTSAGMPEHARAISSAPPSAGGRRPGWGIGIAAVAVAVVAAAGALAVYEFRSAPKAESIAVGGLAPDFSLHDAQKDDRDAPVSLSQMVPKGPVVVIFNMGLHCAACTEDLGKYAGQIDDFKHAGIQVVAVSHETTDQTRSELKFSGPIPFPLLSDPDNKVARSFGLAAPDGTLNERTFLVDHDRRIQWIETPDRPGGAISHILDAVTAKNLR